NRAQCSWRIAASHSSSIRSFFQLFPYPLNPRYNSVHGRRTRSPAVAGTDQRHPKATPFFRRGWTRAMWSRSPPTHLAGLFAQIRFDPELLVLGVLLIVAIVAGCIIVARVRRWRQEDAAPVPLEDQMKSYGELVERGELSPQEFERIKARLEQKAVETPPPPIQ